AAASGLGWCFLGSVVTRVQTTRRPPATLGRSLPGVTDSSGQEKRGTEVTFVPLSRAHRAVAQISASPRSWLPRRGDRAGSTDSRDEPSRGTETRPCR